jgi:hypothetical protein
MREYHEHVDEQLRIMRERLASGAKELGEEPWYAPGHTTPGLARDLITLSQQTIDMEETRAREWSLLFPLVVAALRNNSVSGVQQLDREISGTLDTCQATPSTTRDK